MLVTWFKCWLGYLRAGFLCFGLCGFVGFAILVWFVFFALNLWWAYVLGYGLMFLCFVVLLKCGCLYAVLDLRYCLLV